MVSAAANAVRALAAQEQVTIIEDRLAELGARAALRDRA